MSEPSFELLVELARRTMSTWRELPDAERMASFGEILTKIRRAGKYITDHDERSIITSYAQEVAEIVYLLTGEYPYARLDEPEFADAADDDGKTTDDQHLRQTEKEYLDKLRRDYAIWSTKYTPLEGVAEVQVRQRSPIVDLKRGFLPAGFDTLVEHGYGAIERFEKETYSDLRNAIGKYRRIVLLGEPGAGKTTTLWRMVYDYAEAAQNDPTVPIPVFVPMGGYTNDEPLHEYAARYAGELGGHLQRYLAEGRIVLLFDGLNEMPRSSHVDRIRRLREFLRKYDNVSAVVTCRTIDYENDLDLNKIEIRPLNRAQQMAFLKNYLGEEDGERLFWQLGGDTKGRRSPTLLNLGVNPYMLVMLSQVFATTGSLPQNRGRLFAAFVYALLSRERIRRAAHGWPGTEAVIDALAELAYAMQEAAEQGTTVQVAWAYERIPNAQDLLYLAESATLLDVAGDSVRFVHRLLEEYFAALAWQKRLIAGNELHNHWPKGWTVPSGWEETALLLAGILPDMTQFVQALTRVNPPLAARCIAESGGNYSKAGIQNDVQTTLMNIATSHAALQVERDMAGDALNILGDVRSGVGLGADGLPVILWCDVPEGEFTMGSQIDDNRANENETPQHRVVLSGFRISTYPVTNCQYAAFVDDGGYTEKWRSCWTQLGWEWRSSEDRTEPERFGGVFDLPNHPVVGLRWYEAHAFCEWLSKKSCQPVRLPTEAEWEKAARGTDDRRYPWGEAIVPDTANYDESRLGTTSAVGIFPKGASPFGLLDMSGNVWEYTSTRYTTYPYDPNDGREDQSVEYDRVLRGGSWDSRFSEISVSARLGYVIPFSQDGFRVAADILPDMPSDIEDTSMQEYV